MKVGYEFLDCDDRTLPHVEMLEEAMATISRLISAPEDETENVVTEWDEALGEAEEELPFELENDDV